MLKKMTTKIKFAYRIWKNVYDYSHIIFIKNYLNYLWDIWNQNILPSACFIIKSY
jgi:hypothetical protein